jgi:hypothetical protein
MSRAPLHRLMPVLLDSGSCSYTSLHLFLHPIAPTCSHLPLQILTHRPSHRQTYAHTCKCKQTATHPHTHTHTHTHTYIHRNTHIHTCTRTRNRVHGGACPTERHSFQKVTFFTRRCSNLPVWCRLSLAKPSNMQTKDLHQAHGYNVNTSAT